MSKQKKDTIKILVELERWQVEKLNEMKKKGIIQFKNSYIRMLISNDIDKKKRKVVEVSGIPGAELF